MPSLHADDPQKHLQLPQLNAISDDRGVTVCFWQSSVLQRWLRLTFPPLHNTIIYVINVHQKANREAALDGDQGVQSPDICMHNARNHIFI